jgi:hypothetical protein
MVILKPRQSTGCLCHKIHSCCRRSMDRTNTRYNIYSSNILNAVNCLCIYLTLRPGRVGIAATSNRIFGMCSVQMSLATTAILTKIFFLFSSVPIAARIILRLAHDRFLSNSFQFITHPAILRYTGLFFILISPQNKASKPMTLRIFTLIPSRYVTDVMCIKYNSQNRRFRSLIHYRFHVICFYWQRRSY